MKKLTSIFFGLVILLVFLRADSVWAQDSLALSVTPTLFDVSVEPGQIWQSSVRVINSNQFDMVVYARPVNFSAVDETGRSHFQPILEAAVDGLTLAEWIDVPTEGIVIPQQQTKEISFTVRVPDNAAPGGQYAAIMVSTEPTQAGEDIAQIRTSQAVTSLFFLRVEGDIVEQGQIRSFRSLQSIVQIPKTEFSLRFQNTGTVHLQPQGEITIYNMWGQKRGEIPVNQRSQFGKVLPDNIREYTFGWEAAFSLVDIGRYRAEATLAYGSTNRSFTSATAHFWVIPVYGLLIVLGTLLTIFLIATWLVRRYVRRMLAMTIADNPAYVTSASRRTVLDGDIDLSKGGLVKEKVKVAVSPISAAWYDVSSRFSLEVGWRAKLSTVAQIGKDYRLAILAVIFIIICLFLILLFRNSVLVPERAYEVVISDEQAETTISSESLRYEGMVQGDFDPIVTIDTEPLIGLPEDITISFINVSGQIGVAASVALAFSQAALDVGTVTADLQRVENRSVIVFDAEYVEQAQSISRALGGALLSARSTSLEGDVPILIYVGTDVTAD